MNNFMENSMNSISLKNQLKYILGFLNLFSHSVIFFNLSPYFQSLFFYYYKNYYHYYYTSVHDMQHTMDIVQYFVNLPSKIVLSIPHCTRIADWETLGYCYKI